MWPGGPPARAEHNAAMKLRQMQCLATLVECGFNVSRAAEALHATQPAVGKQLRQFEEELGVDLFLRRGAKIVGLTRNGEDIVRWCRVALQAAGNIRHIARDAVQEGRGSVTLGTTHTHARYVIIDAVRDFSRLYPHVRLHLLQGTPEGVLQMVRDGQVDLGVSSQPQHDDDEVLAVPFLQVGKLLLLPPDHELAGKAEITLQDIAAHPLISNNVTRPEGARLQAAFRAAGLEPRVAMEALDADVMKSYVAAGLGIAIIPAVTYDPELDARLVVRRLDALFEPSASCVLLRRGTYLSRAAYYFLERLAPELTRERLDALLLADSGQD